MFRQEATGLPAIEPDTPRFFTLNGSQGPKFLFERPEEQRVVCVV